MRVSYVIFLIPSPLPFLPRSLASVASASIKVTGKTNGVSIDKLSVGTDKKIAGEFSMAEAFPGTKLTFKATDGSRAAGMDAITAVIGAEHKAGNAVITLDVDAIKAGVDFSALVNYEGILVGGSAKASMANGFKVADFGVALGYKTSDYSIVAVADKRVRVNSMMRWPHSPWLTPVIRP